MQSINYELIPATVTYLEMHQKPSFDWTAWPGTDISKLEKPITAETYRKYYYGVGKNHNWLDRMVMPDEELLGKINDPKTEIFLMHFNSQLAGFAEFIVETDFTELLYFGLFPEFVGKGFGKYFLQWAIQKAWSYHPKWIQLNTCTLDHSNALSVYKNAGFVPVKTEVQERKKSI